MICTFLSTTEMALCTMVQQTTVV